MNFLKSTLTIAITSVLFVSCKENTDSTVSDTADGPKVKKEITATNLQTASFSIKGMSCAVGCAKTIEKELNNLDGVKAATVDFDNESAIISYDKSLLTAEGIKKIVESTGDGKTYVVSDFN